MRIASWLVLLVAFSMGLVSAFVVAYYTFDAKPIEIADEGPTVKILVAQKEISIGAEIVAEDIFFENVSVSEIPPLALTNFMQVYRRRPAYPIPVGCPVCEDLLLPRETGSEDAEKFIPAGTKIVSLEVEQFRFGDTVSDLEIPISNILSVGDVIDVKVVSKEEPKGRYVARKNEVLRAFARTNNAAGEIVLENVRIHALTSKASLASAKQIQTLSLLLEKEDADKLTLAARDGRIRVVPHRSHSEVNVEEKIAEIQDEERLFASLELEKLDLAPMELERVELENTHTIASEILAREEVTQLEEVAQITHREDIAQVDEFVQIDKVAQIAEFVQVDAAMEEQDSTFHTPIFVAMADTTHDSMPSVKESADKNSNFDSDDVVVETVIVKSMIVPDARTDVRFRDSSDTDSAQVSFVVPRLKDNIRNDTNIPSNPAPVSSMIASESFGTDTSATKDSEQATAVFRPRLPIHVASLNGTKNGTLPPLEAQGYASSYSPFNMGARTVLTAPENAEEDQLSQPLPLRARPMASLEWK